MCECTTNIETDYLSPSTRQQLTDNHALTGTHRLANNFCFGVGLDRCTSTNPYVGESCAYGDVDKKQNAKCPKCLCQIIDGACGIGSDDDHCNPSKNNGFFDGH